MSDNEIKLAKAMADIEAKRMKDEDRERMRRLLDLLDLREDAILTSGQIQKIIISEIARLRAQFEQERALRTRLKDEMRRWGEMLKQALPFLGSHGKQGHLKSEIEALDDD